MTRSEARAALWAQFAAGALVAGIPRSFAAESADQLLVEFEKRFKWMQPYGGPNWGAPGRWTEKEEVSK